MVSQNLFPSNRYDGSKCLDTLDMLVNFKLAIADLLSNQGKTLVRKLRDLTIDNDNE